MASPWAFITARPAPGYRGGLPGGPQDFRAQSLSANWSWGTEPATAELVYVGSGAAPVTAGNWMTIIAAGHTFYGNCVRANSVVASGGFKTTISFEDNRTYLKWDSVYCAFNMKDERIENGVRIKRYWHILPAHFNLQRRTYTSSPLSAAQILDYVFGASTVEDSWVRVYHADQFTYPVYDLNWLGGVKLASAINQVSDEHGLQFTLMGGPFRLVWSRRGEGIAPAFSADSDNRETGLALSGHGTRIRVLGDRNEYQVHDIPMTKDWKAPWEEYFHMSKFREAVWEHAKNVTRITIGGRTWLPNEDTFKNIAQSDEAKRDDPHQLITRQLASARAAEITVGDWAEIRQSSTWNDTRSFNGKSRSSMPAILYINQILYRAFTFQSGFTIRTTAGNYRVVDAQLTQKMIARVRHDPTTAEMSWSVGETHDGPGYAIVRGYSVGQNLFKDINPDRFNINDWNEAQDVWEAIPIQIDDGSDDVPFILFDAPVIRSADLIKMIDGQAVLNAKPTITVPEVRAALTFQCEIFSRVRGTGTRDDFTQIPGLNAQYVGRHNANPAEVAFADGRLAHQKADLIATPLLSRQFSHTSGKSDRHVYPVNGVFAQGTQLTGAIDRVTLSINPGQGVTESVHLTSEAPRKTFVPERQLDRQVRDEGLFAGQRELMNNSAIRRLTAAALQQSPEARQLLTDAFNQRIGTAAPGEQTMIAPDEE